MKVQKVKLLKKKHFKSLYSRDHMVKNIVTFNPVCFELPPLENGKNFGPEIRKNGSIYHYDCNKGFKLSPRSSKYATCTENGTYKWNYENIYPGVFQVKKNTRLLETPTQSNYYYEILYKG